ncbi:hypothetical protein GRAN_0797 [Granulicella sibirica]|uniref:Uncharacterized protein n=1 Tax=Granulicella sibirica TaxID=2479048 RepID=A0A4Q0T2P3_9BACT|nr:hypothetical protein GRAN_0797 [Granulicella sibirica]
MDKTMRRLRTQADLDEQQRETTGIGRMSRRVNGLRDLRAQHGLLQLEGGAF